MNKIPDLGDISKYANDSYSSEFWDKITETIRKEHVEYVSMCDKNKVTQKDLKHQYTL